MKNNPTRFIKIGKMRVKFNHIFVVSVVIVYFAYIETWKEKGPNLRPKKHIKKNTMKKIYINLNKPRYHTLFFAE